MMINALTALEVGATLPKAAILVVIEAASGDKMKLTSASLAEALRLSPPLIRHHLRALVDENLVKMGKPQGQGGARHLFLTPSGKKVAVALSKT